MSDRFRYTVIVASNGYIAQPHIRQRVAETLCEMFEGFTLTSVEGWWRGECEPAYQYTISTENPSLDAIKTLFTNAAISAGDLEWLHIERELVTAHHVRVTREDVIAVSVDQLMADHAGGWPRSKGNLGADHASNPSDASAHEILAANSGEWPRG